MSLSAIHLLVRMRLEREQSKTCAFASGESGSLEHVLGNCLAEQHSAAVPVVCKALQLQRMNLSIQPNWCLRVPCGCLVCGVHVYT
jgi:hypothetical protein